MRWLWTVVAGWEGHAMTTVPFALALFVLVETALRAGKKRRFK